MVPQGNWSTVIRSKQMIVVYGTHGVLSFCSTNHSHWSSLPECQEPDSLVTVNDSFLNVCCPLLGLPHPCCSLAGLPSVGTASLLHSPPQMPSSSESWLRLVQAWINLRAYYWYSFMVLTVKCLIRELVPMILTSPRNGQHDDWLISELSRAQMQDLVHSASFIICIDWFWTCHPLR